MTLTGWIEGLSETAEKAVVNLYVKKQRGYPLTDAEWAKYHPSRCGWPEYERQRAGRMTLPGYSSFVPWWLEQCEIPGPRDGDWRKANG